MKTIAIPLALLLAAFSTTAFGQTSNNPLPGMITVTGNAQVTATPDQAVVRVGIVRQSGTAKEAQEETNKIAQAILKAIGAVGVPAQRIQTSRLTVTPIYAQQRPANNDPPRITGYMAANTVSVTIDNLTQVGPVVDAALDSGANQLESLQFRLKDDATVREQALKRAVAEARDKAAAIADTLSVQLGPVLEVMESGVSVVPFEQPRAFLAAAERAATPTPVSAGEIQINASVSIRYAIRPR